MVAASETARDKAESALEKGHDAYTSAAEVGGRAPAAVAVLKGDKVATTAGRRRKVTLVIALIAGVGGAVAYFLNRKPKDDPWATPISTPSRATSSTTSSNGSVSDLKANVAGVADAAKDKASDVADDAKDAAGEAADDAKKTVDDATS